MNIKKYIISMLLLITLTYAIEIPISKVKYDYIKEYSVFNGKVISAYDIEPYINNIKVEENMYYIMIYIPLSKRNMINIGQSVIINKEIKTHIKFISPSLDKQSQNIIAYCKVDNRKLFLNEFVEVDIISMSSNKYKLINKTALSFYKNEWVVYVPKEHDSHEEEHEEHDVENENHDEHEEESEVPYDITIIKIITQDSDYIAIEGIKLGEEYVSDKSYFIKSLLLKSSLGGHGH
jgi:hypothetical protein